MKHTEFEWRTKDGLELYARQWETAASPRAVICLVHGLGEHSGRYSHLAAFLTGKGYSLVSFDQRGHGKSQGKQGYTPSYEALMEDIDLLMDHALALYPDTPRILYGHSLGGGLALNYSLRRKPDISGVVSTSPWLRLTKEPPAPLVQLLSALDSLWPSFSMSNGLDVRDISHDPAVVRAYINDPLVHDRITARLCITAYRAGIWALDHAGEFSLPLLIMHGSADRITSPRAAEQFARQVPADCTLKIWDGLFHETQNEPQNDEVFNYLLEWLNNRV